MGETLKQFHKIPSSKGYIAPRKRINALGIFYEPTRELPNDQLPHNARKILCYNSEGDCHGLERIPLDMRDAFERVA